ncbi:nicotinate-nucleotide adenylyltransferase [Geomobilimonas luticola]|uniref:Probable nicotinate-nucleotide adenylyltransferase n=1 Tax=Geomobilimonas luticola TaxID=1114878 RepID=A0ABS5SA55_9BACT|nr:nicotinate-nucleotide adenylyltransferase [Geomobilimonas luticola]MBT0651497.1 nicotinate-nucleotide adenylyltransferase [Geomobilimonas luticola]
MKIGIIGGTFNPIHLAHLRIAEEVRDSLDLVRVVFIPAASPPHKPLAGEIPFVHRVAMVRLAVQDNPAFSVSEVEGERGGRSYSIDTLRTLRADRPDDEFFFIVGSDSFLEIGSWHEFAAIFACCNLVVVERPGAAIADLQAVLPAAVAGEFRYLPAEHRLVHRSGYSVHYLRGIPFDISSSAIRERARQGRSLRYLVPATVENYIKEQRLYAHEY